MRLLSLISVIFLLGACATTYDTDTMTSSSAYPIGSGISESDIASIILTAHQGEVDAGNAALTLATSPAVRSFAQMMVRDHTNALNSAQTTFQRVGIASTPNNTSRQLESGVRQTISALNTYSGPAFDRAYIQAQVDMHQWMLTNLDNGFIPSARTADVRNLLQAQRSSVMTHLDHARQTLNGLP